MANVPSRGLIIGAALLWLKVAIVVYYLEGESILRVYLWLLTLTVGDLAVGPRGSVSDLLLFSLI